MGTKYMQTGRTTRMLESATKYAIATLEQAVFVVLPTQVSADCIKKIRRPAGGFPPNLHFIGASSSRVSNMDFKDKRITLRREGTYSAFFDHSVIEQQILRLQAFADEYCAKPGDYGYCP